MVAQSHKRLILEFGSGHDIQIYMNEVWRGRYVVKEVRGRKQRGGKKNVRKMYEIGNSVGVKSQ